MRALPFFIFTIVLLNAFGISNPVLAGTVSKSSDNKVIIDFEGESIPNPNDRFYVLDQSSHKEIGIVQIIKIKGSRALAKLLKGKAKPGDSTDVAQSGKKGRAQKQVAKNTADDSGESDDREPAQSSRSRSSRSERGGGSGSFGVGANFIYTSFYLKMPDGSGEGSISGTSFGFRAAYDMPMSSSFALHFAGGYHTSAASTAIDGNTYKFQASYLALEGIGRLSLEGRQKEGLWIGGGLGLYSPISYDKTSATKPSTEVGLIGSGGYNLRFGREFAAIKGDFIMLKDNTFQVVAGGVYFF